MSYENSEPKILKTLNSDGQVLDDSGNIISDSTDYWKKTYNESEPKPDKILHSDGTIKDSAGNVIQESTEFNIKKYNQAEPIPAKYLHADGTIDENPGSGGGGGGDSGSATAYAWKSASDDSFILYLSVDKALDSSSDVKILYTSGGEGYKVSEIGTLLEEEGWEGTYTKVSDSQFQILWEGATEPEIFERYSEGDVIIWEGEGGGNTTAYVWHYYYVDSMHPEVMDFGIKYFDFSSAPSTQSDFERGNILLYDEGLKVGKNEESFPPIATYSVSEGEISFSDEYECIHRFVRESSNDLSIWEASGDVTVEPLSVTENGTYTAPSGKAYTPVTVNVSGGVNTLFAFIHDDYVYYSTALDLNTGDKLLSITITGYDPINDIIIASYDSSTNTATDEYGTIYQYDSTKNISLV